MTTSTIDKKKGGAAPPDQASSTASAVRADLPVPRIVAPELRMEPNFDEKSAHKRFAESGWKKNPVTMFRGASDFPAENELGWHRYKCRAVDAIPDPGGGNFRSRETTWPTHYIVAPDAAEAERVYREAVEGLRLANRRDKAHLEVAVKELED
jgi:hypothetical protein